MSDSGYRLAIYPDPAAWRAAARGTEARETSVSVATAEILAAVREEGDEALCRLARRFDGVELGPESLRVSAEELEELASRLDSEDRRILEQARDRIAAFHERQAEASFRMALPHEAELEWRVFPVSSVGVYVPGGAAAYPSTVLMNTVPARVAGVPRIALATPPGALSRHPALAAAIRLAGVTEVYRVGGAQAIAAFAFGTGSIPKVRQVVGPGNAFVAEAKRQLAEVVGVDAVAGPSEVVVVADGSASPEWVAADLLAQAEHGSGDELAVLITTSETVALETAAAVARQAPGQPNRETIVRALARRGAAVLVADLEEAVALAEEIAPEHLEIMVENPESLADRFPSAGSVLVGPYAPVALGDYGIGPNHVLPTGGAARFGSPLSVADFRKRQSVIRVGRPALLADRAEYARFARMEGFEAHARSLEIRFEAEPSSIPPSPPGGGHESRS